ncbi:MAG: hypothetical protein JSR66_12860 [Proteobacteria bacterium]|nr:hypothetical protein [Pseudomonadota bacterium]
MNTRTLRPVLLAALCGILSLAAGLARADITLEHTMAVEGVGAMAFGNMSGTSKTTISGDRSRTDSDIKMKSKLVGFLARNAVGPSAEIVLLDQDKLYHLNINKKEYTETTFEQMRERMQKATDQMNSADERKQPSAVDQSKCEWLPARADVKKTGEKAQYAGYDSERVVITAAQPCKDKETGSICEVALVLDNWMAPGFAEGSEAQKFYKAYAAKMGLDTSGSQDISQRARQLFSQYKGIWSEIATKMQGVKGYPVRSSFTLAMGGAQCKDPKAHQSAESQDSDSSSNNPAALAGAVAGKLGGLFHKKKDDSDSAPAAAAPAPAVSPAPLPPGDVALITVSSQLVSVSGNSASADAFTVPADFKKTEMR